MISLALVSDRRALLARACSVTFGRASAGYPQPTAARILHGAIPMTRVQAWGTL